MAVDTFVRATAQSGLEFEIREMDDTTHTALDAANALGCPVDAKRVKRVTGYSIGGVPPFGHPQPIRTVMDETLLELEVVWAAAGSAKAVFPIEPGRLAELVSATVGRVC